MRQHIRSQCTCSQSYALRMRNLSKPKFGHVMKPNLTFFPPRLWKRFLKLECLSEIQKSFPNDLFLVHFQTYFNWDDWYGWFWTKKYFIDVDFGSGVFKNYTVLQPVSIKAEDNSKDFCPNWQPTCELFAFVCVRKLLE